VLVTLTAEAIVPPAARLIVDGFKPICGPLAMLGDVVADRVIVPEKAFLLTSASTNVPFEAWSTVKLGGVTRVKSGVVPDEGAKTRGRWSTFIPVVCPHLLHKPLTQVWG